MTNYKELGQKEINTHFIAACGQCDLSLIKHLLTSKDLKKKANIHAQKDEGLRLACLNGKAEKQLEVVKYLLTSTEIKEHADITNESCFLAAVAFGKLEVIQYMLCAPELKQHANIHADSDHAFYAACKYERLDVLEFYINQYKLKITPIMLADVKQNIGISAYETCIKMLNCMSLAEKINNDLPPKDISAKKHKI